VGRTGLSGWGSLEGDLRAAICELQQGWSAAFVRNGVVLGREQGKGIGPALKMVQARMAQDRWSRSASREAPACAFADRVLGLAAFRLGRLLGARIIWGEMASELAILEGRRLGVEVRCHRAVPAVMTYTRDGLCPMEHLAFRSESDLEFYLAAAGLVL